MYDINKQVQEVINEHKDRYAGDVNTKIAYLKFLGTTGVNIVTITQYSYAFLNIAAVYEQMFNKDIYDFNKDQMKMLLKGLLKPSLASLASQKCILEGYVTFAINKGFGLRTEHAIYALTKEELEGCLNNVALNERFPTYHELMEGIEKLGTFQSKSIWLLAWLGLYNEKYTVMRELKVSDFNFIENTISIEIPDKKGSFVHKVIPFNQDEKYIFQVAKEEEGVLMMCKHGTEILRKYRESDRFLKSNNKNAKSDIVSRATLFSRIKETENRHWTLKTVYVAGIAYRLLQIKEDWKLHEIEVYLKENNIKIWHITISNMLEIYKAKLEKEKFFTKHKEVAPTSINNS